jgi:hypothetical protein
MGWLAPVLRAIFGSLVHVEGCIKVRLSSENTIEHAGRHETAQSV